MGWLSIFDSLIPMPKDGEPGPTGPAGQNAQMYVLTITSAILRVLPKNDGGERLIEEYIAGKLEYVDGNSRSAVNLSARRDISIQVIFDNKTEGYYITGIDGYGQRNLDGTWNDSGLFTDSVYGGETIGKPKYIRVWVWTRDADDNLITLAETTVPLIVEGETGAKGDDSVSYAILTDRDHLRVVDEDVQIRILITTGKSAVDVGLHTAKETYGLTMTALLGGKEISHLVETVDDGDSQIYGFSPKLGQMLDMKLWKSNQLVARKTMYVTSDGVLGKLIYPAGKYSATETYKSTTKSAPMVELDGLFYYLEATTSVKGVNPATDVANKGGNWALMDTIKAQFVEILMANFAKLASAVFSGDYMLSQYGIDSNGNISKDYQKFAEGTFTPNLLIDFLNGSIRCRKAEVEGVVKAKHFHVVFSNFSYPEELDGTINIEQHGTNLLLDSSCDITVYPNRELLLPYADAYPGLLLYLYVPVSASRTGMAAKLRYNNGIMDGSGWNSSLYTTYTIEGGYHQLLAVGSQWIVLPPVLGSLE